MHYYVQAVFGICNSEIHAALLASHLDSVLANTRYIFFNSYRTEFMFDIACFFLFVQGVHYKEALKILKLVVTRSSTLVAPPTSVHPPHWETSATSPHPSFTDSEIFTKKELPGI